MNPRYMRATKPTTTAAAATSAAATAAADCAAAALLLQHQIAIEVQPKGKRHQQKIKTTLK